MLGLPFVLGVRDACAIGSFPAFRRENTALTPRSSYNSETKKLAGHHTAYASGGVCEFQFFSLWSVQDSFADCISRLALPACPNEIMREAQTCFMASRAGLR